jgi:hypothetical protein
VSATVFKLHPPSAQEKEEAAYRLEHVIRVRGENPVFVGRGLPSEHAADGTHSGFVLYEDLTGLKPLCSVRRAPAAGPDDRLVVTAPDGAELGVLRQPARTRGWRPSYEMELLDGTSLVGRGGTVPSWVVYVVLSPLLLIYSVLHLLGGYGRPDWFLPTRTAWRSRGGAGLASLKFYGMTDKYKVRAERLDPRLAYAQAVVHHSAG